jgi:hypothetical protein
MLRDEIKCSLLEEKIIGSCNNCSLRKICDGVDKAAAELKNRANKKGSFHNID